MKRRGCVPDALITRNMRLLQFTRFLVLEVQSVAKQSRCAGCSLGLLVVGDIYFKGKEREMLTVRGEGG